MEFAIELSRLSIRDSSAVRLRREHFSNINMFTLPNEDKINMIQLLFSARVRQLIDATGFQSIELRLLDYVTTLLGYGLIAVPLRLHCGFISVSFRFHFGFISVSFRFQHPTQTAMNAECSLNETIWKDLVDWSENLHLATDVGLNCDRSCCPLNPVGFNSSSRTTDSRIWRHIKAIPVSITET